MKIFTVFAIFLLLVNCDPDNFEGKPLVLVNNSAEAVYFYNSDNFSEGHFPDTTLPKQKPNALVRLVVNGKKGQYEDPSWERIYSELPDAKFTVYVFSIKLVDTTSWEEIRENYLILERFDITLEELKESDYTITYFGN